MDTQTLYIYTGINWTEIQVCMHVLYSHNNSDAIIMYVSM